MLLLTYFVVHLENPDPMALASPVGTATPAPVVESISGAGSHSLSSLAVPAGKDVTLEVWSPGGGGGAGGTAAAGAGGGPGTYAAMLVPSALWALGGTIVLGAAGTAGVAAGAGGDGADCTVTINSILYGTIGAGHGGAANGGAPGGPRTTTINGALAPSVAKPGSAAPAIPGGGHGGAGAPSVGPGGGAGGAGGVAAGVGAVGGTPSGGGGGGSSTPSNGGAGGPPALRYSWPV